MTQEEIIEGNKIIAEFMDKTVCPTNLTKDFGTRNNYDFYPLELQYHISWDWLMPVWIKSMLWYRNEFGLMTSTFEITNMGMQIKATNSSAFKYADLFLKDATEEEIRKSVWLAVVEFIKWYIKTNHNEIHTNYFNANACYYSSSNFSDRANWFCFKG